jgi:hypothetical protein
MNSRISRPKMEKRKNYESYLFSQTDVKFFQLFWSPFFLQFHLLLKELTGRTGRI